MWVRGCVRETSIHSAATFSGFLHIFKTDWLPKGALSHLFKGCWWISTSRRIQTNYASSPGKAKPPRWASVKPSRHWLSWGASRCRCSWQRMGGERMRGPGCTEHSWVGCGWTFSPNEQRRTRRLCHFPGQFDPGAEQRLIRDSFTPTMSWKLTRCRERRRFLCSFHSCYLNSLPSTETDYLELFKIVRLNDLLFT